MTRPAPAALQHELLAGCGLQHGFGVRGSVAPPGTMRPTQLHGRVVARATEAGLEPEEADAVVSALPARPVAVVTADCVPILACTGDGSRVAAIHAGWRGLAAGVVAAGVRELEGAYGDAADLIAVVGPCIGACCYEVDAPVLDALDARFGDRLRPALGKSRPGHAKLDLAELVRVELERCGLAPTRVGAVPNGCTRCDGARFHSYRRDGEAAGRLVHHIAAR